MMAKQLGIESAVRMHARMCNARHTSIQKFPSFHQDYCVQPEEKQQIDPDGEQYPEYGCNQANDCIIEEKCILKPIPETPVWGCKIIPLHVTKNYAHYLVAYQ